MEAVRGSTQPEQEARTYGSLVEYLTEDGEAHIVERTREVAGVIGEILETDQNDKLKGVLDDSYLAQQKLGHLAFVVDSTPRSMLELDEFELSNGTRLEEVIYNDEEVSPVLRSGQAKDESEAKARRALVMRAACKAIAADREELPTEEKDCA